MDTQPVNQVSRGNRYLPIAVSYLLVTLMMVCFSVLIVNIGERIFLSQEINYLVFISVFISLEVFITHRATAETAVLTPEWFFYRGSEWVFNLIAIKLVMYAVHGFDRLLVDIQSWQQNFLQNFFTSEYFVSLVFALFVWFIVSQYANLLRLLEHDPDQLDLERLGYGLRDRQSIRQQLMGMIFTLGMILLAVTALINQDLSVINIQTAPVNTRAWVLLLYFVCGLGLLALTQFDVLRSSWYIHNIPTVPNLAVRWAVYVVLVLIGVTAIVSILPTRYSLGFLDVLAWIISVLGSIFGLLQIILLTPFLLALRWLAGLLGMSTSQNSPAPMPTLPPPGSMEPGTSMPILDVLKSVFFWVAFLGIVGFFLIQYARQRSEWVHSVFSLPIPGLLRRFRTWLLGFFRRTRVTLIRTLEQVVQGFERRRLKNEGTRKDIRQGRSHLSPREQVLSIYTKMIEENADLELPRKPEQTPLEYAADMKTTLPEVNQEIDSLTATFMEAKYSRHEITGEAVTRSQSFFRRIYTNLMELRTKKNG